MYAGSSRPGTETHISCIGRWILYHWTTRDALWSWTLKIVFWDSGEAWEATPKAFDFKRQGHKGFSVMGYSFFSIPIATKRCWRSQPWILPMLSWWINSGILVAMKGAGGSSSTVSRPSPVHACWGPRGPLCPGCWWTRWESCGWQAPCLSTRPRGSSPTSPVSMSRLWTNLGSPCIPTLTRPITPCKEYAPTCRVSLCPAAGTNGTSCLCKADLNAREHWAGAECGWRSQQRERVQCNEGRWNGLSSEEAVMCGEQDRLSPCAQILPRVSLVSSVGNSSSPQLSGYLDTFSILVMIYT